MKRIFTIFLLLLLIGCKSGKVEVSDEASAIMIAKGALKNTDIGSDIESYKPFKARLVDADTWEVAPTDMAEIAGRPPSVFIRKSDGKVLKILWGEGDVW